MWLRLLVTFGEEGKTMGILCWAYIGDGRCYVASGIQSHGDLAGVSLLSSCMCGWACERVVSLTQGSAARRLIFRFSLFQLSDPVFCMTVFPCYWCTFTGAFVASPLPSATH